MEKEDILSNHSENTSKLKRLEEYKSRTDLKRHLILTFGSLLEASKVAGLSKGRTSQILAGYDMPKSPSLIKRLSECWKIDLVLLTQIFANIENTQQQSGEEKT